MIFKRQKYIDKLVAGLGNGLVKIVTGGRRCGKSFLLFNLFHEYLISHNVAEDHIIELSLDDRKNKPLRNPDALLDFIDKRVKKDEDTYYVILDEVQMVEDFVEVILSLMHTPRMEVLVSGSNSRFLSKDVATEFRGRGEEIRVWPLSFSEYYEEMGGERALAWRDYYTYGGLPQVALLHDGEQKVEYLRNMYELTYLRDIIERNHLRNAEGMRQMVQILSSGIGSSTNPKRICNTFQSVENVAISHNTIKDYIAYLQDAFLVEEAMRYDVKGRKYIGTESKYYFTDMGLRGAVLGFRQQEETHIMENVIYNELRMRGFLVDVGMIEAWKKDKNDHNVRRKLEIDFVANKGSQRYYIQSAFAISDREKKEQEEASLKAVKDAFKRVVILRNDIMPYHDENGFLIIGLLDFLLQENSLDL
ncbi:MAG: ATP-binding protein [Bacteroidaceae bacterium]|nr:ATP-binding protein [Bacteroidaceae bacterium]